MDRDIHLLMTTRNRKTFDEQALLWPGIERFATLTHKCVCTDPDCLMKCIQSVGRWFPSSLIFSQFLDDIVDVTTDEELHAKMFMYAERYPFFARNLEAAYEAQNERGDGVSQRFEADKRTLH